MTEEEAEICRNHAKEDAQLYARAHDRRTIRQLLKLLEARRKLYGTAIPKPYLWTFEEELKAAYISL